MKATVTHLSPSALRVRQHRARQSLYAQQERRRRDKERKSAKRKYDRTQESENQSEKRKQVERERKSAKRKHDRTQESENQREKRKQVDRERKSAKRKRESPVKREEQKLKDRSRKRRQIKDLREVQKELLFDSVELPDAESHSAFMKEAIAKAMKEAKQVLHRTRDENDPSRHKVPVCIICDCFILGTETIKYLKPNDIKKHKHRIGVASYETYYKATLHQDLVKHYRVPNMPGLLLSPRSRKTDRGYETCSTCYTGMQPSCITRNCPPKYAIANGFVIGSFPEVITFKDKDGVERREEINVEEDVNDVLRAYLSPIRPYGYIFAYSGGAHQSIQGNVTFFEMPQSHVSGVMKCLDPDNVGKTIFCMTCGRMTPKQKDIVRKRTEICTKKYMDILSWFIQKSGHPGYKDLPLPENIQVPKLIEERDSTNNIDPSVNSEIEDTFTGGTYFFSCAGDPSHNTSCYGTQNNFALALMNRSAPTLLAVGGNIAKSNEINVEDVLPFAFPYGLGGPNMLRR